MVVMLRRAKWARPKLLGNTQVGGRTELEKRQQGSWETGQGVYTSRAGGLCGRDIPNEGGHGREAWRWPCWIQDGCWMDKTDDMTDHKRRGQFWLSVMQASRRGMHCMSIFGLLIQSNPGLVADMHQGAGLPVRCRPIGNLSPRMDGAGQKISSGEGGESHRARREVTEPFINPLAAVKAVGT